MRLLSFTVLFSASWIMNTIVHLTDVPKNTIAMLGTRVELVCQTDAKIPVRWNFSLAGSQKSTFIYHTSIIDLNLGDKYAIDKRETGRYNLIMNTVELSMGGTYTCSDTPSSQSGQQSTRLSGSAELIVIVADPVCNTNASAVVVEGAYIQIFCIVNYTGNWIPEINCNKSSGRNIDGITSYMYATGMSSLITQLTSDDNRETFMCNMTFNPTSTNNRTTREVNQDNSVPDYHHSWTFTVNVTDVTTVIDREKITLPADTMPDLKGDDVQPSSAGLTTIQLGVVIGIIAGSVILCIFIAIIIFNTSKKGHTKPDIVPEANQTSNGFRSEETRPSSVYASVIKKTRVRDTTNHTVTNDSQQNQNIPVYEEVKKIENVGDTNKHTAMHNSQQTQNIPVYEEVKKIENDEKIPGPSGQIQLPTETEPQRQRNHVGADGTQYLELDSLTVLKSNGVTERKPQIFNLVETYASIDHSMKAPPPPPQLPRRHCY